MRRSDGPDGKGRALPLLRGHPGTAGLGASGARSAALGPSSLCAFVRVSGRGGREDRPKTVECVVAGGLAAATRRVLGPKESGPSL